ncbi:hypothetical protein KP007_13055 [Raoultella ornithinolytica]|nr:hypothetical protein KP007_13055 [Raoultella ornithinolytica]
MKEDVATLTLEDTQGAARLSVWSVAGDNIVNDFESVNFIQSEKLRCMNNASESLDGEEYGLGHYSFATTSLVRIMYIMLNCI